MAGSLAFLEERVSLALNWTVSRFYRFWSGSSSSFIPLDDEGCWPYRLGYGPLFSICCALRLARFNTNIDGPELPPWAKNFFTGVPAPAGGGLVLLPLILSFQVDSALVRDPVVVGLTIVAVAFLLVSGLPTFSFKNFRVSQRLVHQQCSL